MKSASSHPFVWEITVGEMIQDAMKDIYHLRKRLRETNLSVVFGPLRYSDR